MSKLLITITLVTLMSAYYVVKCTPQFKILSYYRGNYVIPDNVTMIRVQGQQKRPTVEVTTKPKYKHKSHIEEESYENDHKYGRRNRKNTKENSIREDINDLYSKNNEKFGRKMKSNGNGAKNGLDKDVMEGDKNYEKTYDFEGREGRKKGQDVEGYDNRFHKDEHYKVHRFYDDDYDNKAFRKGLKVFDDEDKDKDKDEDDDETFY